MNPPSSSRLRAWLELGRISNLPTIWTNVLTGCAIAGLHETTYEAVLPPFNSPAMFIGAIAVAMSLFYVAGMALNDLADVDVDAVERPHRPIPSGRISRNFALWFIIACFVDGMVLMWYIMPASMLYVLPLLIVIIAYNFLHKRFQTSVLLMGACRSLVLLTAATLAEGETFDTIALPMALALGLYIVGITVIARGEMEGRIDERKWLAVAMPVVVLVMVGVIRPIDWRWTALAAFVLSMWLAQAIRYVFERPPKTIKAVLTWLSGICLVDAYFLCLLDAPWLALIAAGCFALTAWGHRKLLGT